MAEKSLSDIDPNFKRRDIEGRELEFHAIPSGPMELGGFAWYEKDKVFCRVPRDALPNMNEGVQFLSRHTSGGTVRFRTDAPTVAISAELDSSQDMNHMPRTGSGFDLYRGRGADLTFVSGSSYASGGKIVEGLLDGEPPEGMRDYTLYFPLYRGVNFARLGVTPGFTVQAPKPLRVQKPLVFYGSSITQGAAASRPGNAYPAFIARWLEANFINLGFSGSARGEPEMAELIASMDMSVFVMDYDHNAKTPERLRETHQPFFRIIRDAQPNLPVVFVTRPDYHEDRETDPQHREIVHATYQAARDAGDGNVYFVDGKTLFGDEDRDACTVDGCHPNDLGFYRMARGIAPAVREALQNR
jgi:lysophospholipase L1-like esterase